MARTDRSSRSLRAVWLTACVLVTVSGLSPAEERPLDFNRDVRPILSDKCFRCHGADEQSRQADLRLDERSSALAERESRFAIVPGDLERSELARRIDTADPDLRMPPLDSHLKLSDQERAVLRRWIAEGAEYQPLWSLMPPRAGVLPEVQDRSWPRNAIDYFVLARIEQAGLTPSPEASRETLLRRVAFDLTGLPPTLEMLDTFLADTSPDAYERVVDRLLASERFGERMAVDWLDAARYADTNGYFGDKARSVWPWRDWVIAAYNRNMAFNEFSIRQLAGDLLPEPTLADRIATGFNRNHMANNETGIVDEEFRVEYVADRLETTAAVWLGLTVGCARCHDHKYDAISQREFYQLFAFFNNGPEKGLITSDNPPPVLELPSAEQQRSLADMAQRRSEAEQAFAPIIERLESRMAEWEASDSSDFAPSPEDGLVAHWDFDERFDSGEVGTSVKFERGVLGQSAVFDATQHVESPLELDLDRPWTIGIWGLSTNSLGCLLSKIEPLGERPGLEVLWQKGRIQIHLVHRWGASALSVATRQAFSSGAWHHLVICYDGSRRAEGLSLFVDGRPEPVVVQMDALAGSAANREPLRVARRDSGLGFYGKLDELRVYQRTLMEQEVERWYWSERLRGIVAVPKEERSALEKDILLDYYLGHFGEAAERAARRRVLEARQAESRLRAEIPTALVMQELPEPRRTTVLERGEYNRPGEAVEPGVPALLPSWPAETPRNRLGLAKWLFLDEHPLTARVAVNRFWLQCFGEGLVATVNDFGSQGEVPTHPELLDWLALEFMRSGWDVKSVLRTIVTSATYRQSSAATERLLEKDADNRLLARGPRFRLSAEMVRDQALAVSGLLVGRLGGPSAKPYQPAGLWEAVTYNGDESYEADQGEGLWRRSLYTFVKRQAPPPMLLTFDGPTREKCTLRRARTNTPLQALVLLNDVTFIEAARGLAAQCLVTSESDSDRLKWAFRRVLSRWPEADESELLMNLLENQRRRFTANPAAAAELVSLGESQAGQSCDSVSLAAWTVTLHTLLNVDEAITRR